MTFLSPLVACSLLLIFIFPTIPTSHGDETLGFQTTLTHVDHNKHLSKIELLRLALDRGSKRLNWVLQAVSSSCTDSNEFPLRNSPEVGDYVMDLSIGTPPVSVSLILDTGSSLIWTQCALCHTCIPQASPMFNPKKSSSYSKLKCSSKQCKALYPWKRKSCAKKPRGSCRFNYRYGDGSRTQGDLATETLWLQNNTISVPKITFGCGFINKGDFSNSSGIVGMGRVNLSLVQQFEDNKFSYYLPTFDSNETGKLLLGNQAITPPGAVTTTLVYNPKVPAFYYLSLEGIHIGASRLAINSSTFRINGDGSGGVIIDSGTEFTYLEASAFKLVKQALIHQLKLDLVDGTDFGFDLCFNSSSSTKKVTFPKFKLLFEGGAKLELIPKNYLISLHETKTTQCLAMVPTSDLSILGSFQQQNTWVVYDLGRDTISFLAES